MKAIAAALLAAALFGASTPAAKILAGEMHPVLLAGLLYAGSGVGLGLWLALRSGRGAPLQRADLPWLAGAVLSGGIIGPVLLILGLVSTSAATSSLLLNLEGVFTALLAWFAFRENFDKRIALGMALIVGGGALLVIEPGALSFNAGTLFIVAACLAWAIDNNLTRRVAAADPATIAAIKGAAAGAVNLAIAALFGAAWPGANALAAAAAVGLFGYGVSLALFVAALRELGTARTAAYFSTAPFVGAAVALTLLGEATGPWFWLAATSMLVGVWLHVSERHVHEHAHAPLEHDHHHMHDEHHRHEHDFPWDGVEPHSHPHRHAPLVHSHGHFPDLHHRHH